MATAQPRRISPPAISEPAAAAELPLKAKELLRSSPIWVVYDLEWTTWDGALARMWSGDGEELEVVQIGACRVDTRDGFRELDHFSVLVKPALSPELSAYFTNLTGIKQSEVDLNGISFPEALQKFQDFAGQDTALLSWGPFQVHDEAESPVLPGDLYVLERNARIHGVSAPARRRAVDAKTLFLASGATEVRTLNSGRVYKIGGEAAAAEMAALGGADGRDAEHDALWDARSICCALRARARDGALADILGLALGETRESFLNNFQPTCKDDSSAVQVCRMALKAASLGTYGVGAMLLDEHGQTVVVGHNEVFVNGFRSDLHAEMVVLNKLESTAELHERLNLRLCTLVTSLEPCPMCMTRIIFAGIGNIRYIAADDIGGMVRRKSSLPPIFQEITDAQKQSWQQAECAQELKELALHIWADTREEVDQKIINRRKSRVDAEMSCKRQRLN